MLAAIFAIAGSCAEAGCHEDDPWVAWLVAFAVGVFVVVGSLAFLVWKRWKRGPWPQFLRLMTGGWRR
jgi:O-antigen/teichoic acid export membrane protein